MRSLGEGGGQEEDGKRVTAAFRKRTVGGTGLEVEIREGW